MTFDVKDSLLTHQKKWAYQKYWVMAHSQAHYNALRFLFKGNDWSMEKVKTFERLITEAETITPTVKTLRTTYQHLWGYFKKSASPVELEDYKCLDRTLEEHPDALLHFLIQMTERYQPTYLINSRLIQEGL